MAKAKKRSAAKKASKRKASSVRVLPRKMSSLIKITLADIRKAEKAEDAIIDMSEWFTPTQVVCTIDNEVVSQKPACILCAAGSVMRYSLGADIRKDLSPSDFTSNSDQLQAINNLREGDAEAAADQLGIEVKEKHGELYTHIPEYRRADPEPFHKAMEKLRQKLIKAGL